MKVKEWIEANEKLMNVGKLRVIITLAKSFKRSDIITDCKIDFGHAKEIFGDFEIFCISIDESEEFQRLCLYICKTKE